MTLQTKLKASTMTNRVAPELLVDRYVAILRNARVRRSSDPIANLYPWHCRRAVVELMTHAETLQKEAASRGESIFVRILTGKCPDHVYGGEIFQAFQRFLLAGGRLRVMAWVESFDSHSSQLISLSDEFPNQVEVITYTSRTPQNHFLVVDNSAYRFESQHEEVPAARFSDFYPEIPARICFNDIAGGTQLVCFFDEIWAAASPEEVSTT